MPEKIILPKTVIDDMCNMFRSGISIVELMSTFKLGRNKVTKTLRQELGDEYDECIKRIMSETSRKGWTSTPDRHIERTPEWNKRIGDAQRGRKLSEERRTQIRTSWATVRASMSPECIKAMYDKIVATKRSNGTFERLGKQHSEWMKANSPLKGRKASNETRQKQREAKARFFASGGTPSQLGLKRTPKERETISTNTKRMWANGKFDYGHNGLWRSKLEISIYEEFLKHFPDTQHSFRLNANGRSYVFDVYVPQLNLLVEVNGDYWHLNPFMYAANHVDESRNVTARGVWEADAMKHRAAFDAGYKVNVLWESSINAVGIAETINNVIINHA